MSIGLSPIQKAQQRHSSRDRNPSTRACEAAMEAFRNHQRNANNNQPPQRNGNNNPPPTTPLPAAAQLPPPAPELPASEQLPPPEIPPLEHPPQEQHLAAEDVSVSGSSDDDDGASVCAAMRAVDSSYSAIDNAIHQYGANEDCDGTDYNFENDAGELDYAAEDYSVNDRVMYYLGGNLICNSTRLAVEIVGAIYALGVVTSEETTNIANRNEKILRVYREYLNAFDPSSFEAGLKDKMLNKLYNAQQNMTGARLWSKSNEWRSELRNNYMPKLPMNLSSLPSGTGLRDAYNKFILDRYKEANQGAVEGMDDGDIVVKPDFWFKHNSTRCLLAAMVHRKNKEIVNDCSSQPAGATRNEIRSNARANLKAARIQESLAMREEDPEYQMFKRIKLNKTQTDIVKTQSEVISLQMKLFQENKDTYIAMNGEDAYNQKISALLHIFPDPVVDVMKEHEESQQQQDGSS